MISKEDSNPEAGSGCGNECLLEGIEGQEAIVIEVERGILGKEICQGSGYTGEILDESPVKASVAQKTSHPFDIHQG